MKLKEFQPASFLHSAEPGLFEVCAGGGLGCCWVLLPAAGMAVKIYNLCNILSHRGHRVHRAFLHFSAYLCGSY